jgi:hypothetical protein
MKRMTETPSHIQEEAETVMKNSCKICNSFLEGLRGIQEMV